MTASKENAMSMKTMALAAAFALAFVIPNTGGAQSPALVEDNADGVLSADPAIWRIADEDTEILLLGTIHFLPENVDWRTQTFEAAFAKADTVYFEVESDGPDAKSKTLNVLMMEGFNPDGGMLTDLLPADAAEKLKVIAKEIGAPIAGIDPMRPWNAFLTLSVQFLISQGFEPGSGVDSILINEARIKGKALRFFETIDEQLQFFTTLPNETETSLLVVTINEWESQKEGFDDLFLAWRNGDPDGIDAQMNKHLRNDAPELFDRLIIERNQKWSQTLSTVMTQETGVIFVAVGAAHLAGEHSVQTIMSENGFSVERLNPVSANDN